MNSPYTDFRAVLFPIQSTWQFSTRGLLTCTRLDRLEREAVFLRAVVYPELAAPSLKGLARALVNWVIGACLTKEHLTDSISVRAVMEE